MKQLTIILSITLIAISATGCATRKFVRQEIGTIHHRADTLESQTETQIEQMQTHIENTDRRVDDTDSRVAAHDEEIDTLSETAMKALERAVEAGKLAEGKLLYEATFSDDGFTFGFDETELSDQAQAALDELAARLKAENRNIYIEIQGHTDATGPDEYNFQVGEKRANAASRYLNMVHGIPLHRMSTLSYGESAPTADNDTREGRALNRRIVVVVLA